MRHTFTTTDEAEARRILAAPDLCHVLSEYDSELRAALKYGVPPEAGQTAESALEWARGRLHAFMGDNNVDLDRLWE
jgi:hypothetical protein